MAGSCCLCIVVVSCNCKAPAPAPRSYAMSNQTVLLAESALISPSSSPSMSDCEMQVLTTLGWQQAYHPKGYSITTHLPPNCSLDTWQLLGCLEGLTSLTLTGKLPDLPDSWASNGSFPALQNMTCISSELAGTLPSIWAEAAAFPQLRSMIFIDTWLSGTLPAEWGQQGAFSRLNHLQLENANFGKHKRYVHIWASFSQGYSKCRYLLISTMTSGQAVIASQTSVLTLETGVQKKLCKLGAELCYISRAPPYQILEISSVIAPQYRKS